MVLVNHSSDCEFVVKLLEDYQDCCIYTCDGVSVIEFGKESHGILMLMMREVDSVTYILWCPYAFIFAVNPVIVPVLSRDSLVSNNPSTLPIGLDGLLNTLDSPTQPQSGAKGSGSEWKNFIFFPVESVRRVARRSFGTRTLTFFRADLITEPTLRFRKGGSSAFMDALSRIVSLTRDPMRTEEWIVDVLRDKCTTSATSNSRQEIEGPTKCSTPVSGSSASQDILKPTLRRAATRKMAAYLDELTWMSSLGVDGRVLNWADLKRAIHHGGVQPSLRKEVWPLLVGVYDPETTFTEREMQRKQQQQAYLQLLEQGTWRLSLQANDAETIGFQEYCSCIVKDVLRTDRNHSVFQREDSPGLKALEHILIAYAHLNPQIGYCQGMTDIVSPLYLILDDESETFWTFVRLMELSLQWNFSSADISSITAQLDFVANMLRIFVPKLYQHLTKLGACDMTFIFRWILVRFKRELSMEDINTLWEVSWCSPNTMDYHLLVAAAILRELSPWIIENIRTPDSLHRVFNQSETWMLVEQIVVFTDEFMKDIVEYTRQVHNYTPRDGEDPSLEMIMAHYLS